MLQSDRLDPLDRYFQLTFRPHGSDSYRPRSCGVELNYWMGAYPKFPAVGNTGLFFQKRENSSRFAVPCKKWSSGSRITCIEMLILLILLE